MDYNVAFQPGLFSGRWCEGKFFVRNTKSLGNQNFALLPFAPEITQINNNKDCTAPLIIVRQKHIVRGPQHASFHRHHIVLSWSGHAVRLLPHLAGTRAQHHVLRITPVTAQSTRNVVLPRTIRSKVLKKETTCE